METQISNEIKEKLNSWMEEHKFRKISLTALITAFTHPSYRGMFPDVEDYERMEFLGDSVLDLVSAEELIQQSNAKEGVLTEQRKLLVNNEYLAQIYEKLKIEQFIRTAPNYIPSQKDKANFVEAFFGVLFLAHRYEYCLEVWQYIQSKMGINKKKQVRAPITLEEEHNKDEFIQFYKNLGLVPKNAKSSLQELCQKQGLEIPKYELIEREGPDHSPIFKVKVSGVLFSGPPKWTRSAIGEGSNKKIAEIKAAEKLCDQIFLPYIPF